jgi:23S rRNA (cytidine1920-2'-O)/16S rRNA (cytidine1409-2'-O)-methyltransferase
MTHGGRQRLDMLAQERYPHYSRNQIQSWIVQGKVLVNGRVVTKSGTMVAPDATIILTVQEPKFVSRGGHKLEKALDTFAIDVTGMVALDAGISTGGFTDCLLQRGAKRVYGIDVGYAQVHEKLRTDPRVIVMERTNLRYVTQLPEPIDIVTLDLAFISVLKVMDAVVAVLKPHGYLVVLIKPQFEAKREQVGRGGIVKDPLVHEMVIDTVVSGVVVRGFMHKGTIESPLIGADGNKEFLAYFIRG